MVKVQDKRSWTQPREQERMREFCRSLDIACVDDQIAKWKRVHEESVSSIPLAIIILMILGAIYLWSAFPNGASTIRWTPAQSIFMYLSALILVLGAVVRLFARWKLARFKKQLDDVKRSL